MSLAADIQPGLVSYFLIAVGKKTAQELEWLFSEIKSPRGKSEPDRGVASGGCAPFDFCQSKPTQKHGNRESVGKSIPYHTTYGIFPYIYHKNQPSGPSTGDHFGNDPKSKVGIYA